MLVSVLPVSSGCQSLMDKTVFLESVLVSDLPVSGGHVVLRGQDCC